VEVVHGSEGGTLSTTINSRDYRHYRTCDYRNKLRNRNITWMD
jgi:hypothetical protein